MKKEEKTNHLVDFALITLIMLLLVILMVTWNNLRIDKTVEGDISLENMMTNDVVGKYQKDNKYVSLVKKANSANFVNVIMEKVVTKEEYDKYNVMIHKAD